MIVHTIFSSGAMEKLLTLFPVISNPAVTSSKFFSNPLSVIKGSTSFHCVMMCIGMD